MHYLLQLFNEEDFMPHGMCLLWRPDLLLLHAVSDSLIALSYYSIPIALIYFATKRRDIEFRWMFVLFGAFILACGTTHIFGVWTLWHPYYLADGAVKALTALTSVGTAALLWRVMPEALAIPGKQHVEAMNRDLETQIDIRRRAEAALAELNADLERRVQDRTAEAERMNADLKEEVAERVRAERKAIENELRFRNLVEGSIQAIVIHRNGKPLFANQAYADLFGCGAPDDVLALDSITRFIAPEEVDRVREHWAALLRGDRLPAVGEVKVQRLDGSPFWVYTQLRVVSWDGEPALQAVLLDITERMQSEDQLRQALKMEAVGQLTGGVAHDFNNILMVIMANVDALEEAETLDPRLLDRIKEISSATQRAADLTRQLLAFSRKQVLRPQHTSINDLVAATGNLLRRTLGEQIEIESILADDIWSTEIDRAQLETALVNLSINARDAMPRGGRLLIETKNVTLDANYVAQNPDAAAGDYVMLAVTDTGSGMSPEILNKVFEPFFTTKGLQGTGLGLSMVYGFIKQSKGHIEIYSEIGGGTSIKLFLPRSDSGLQEMMAPQSSPTPRGNERVLVVEDDEQVRTAITSQLQSLGYAVAGATDGAAGLAAFEAASQPYDLLLTDVVMPGLLNGKALADQVTRRWPKSKVVFMSGYTETAIIHQGRLDAGVLLLSKPFRKIDLAQILRQALDGTVDPDR